MYLDYVLNGSGERTGFIHWWPFCLANDRTSSAANIFFFFSPRFIKPLLYLTVPLPADKLHTSLCLFAVHLSLPEMAELKFAEGMLVWWRWPTSSPPFFFSFTSCLSPKRSQSWCNNRTQESGEVSLSFLRFCSNSFEVEVVYVLNILKLSSLDIAVQR